MNMVFAQTAVFIGDWRALRFGDEELRGLELSLMQNPEAGRIIANAGGVRKIRFAPEGRGKSGSTRVVYLFLPAYRKLYLLLAFGKDEQANLSAADKKFCREMVAKIKQSLKGE